MASGTLRYGVAVLAVELAVGALFIPGVGRGFSSILFFAVLISAWYGGLGPGLLATGLTLVTGVTLMVAFGMPFPPWRVLSLALFTAGGALITLLVEALHAARRREEHSNGRLAAVLTSIGDAVIATDLQGRVTFLNPVAESLTGWGADEAAGRPLEEVFRIVSESSRAAVENPVARVLRERVVVGLGNHTLLIARDGTELPIDDSAAPIRDAQGAAQGVVLVFRDIVDRKQVEERQRLLAEDNARLFDEAMEAARRREDALQRHRSMEEQLTLLVEASGTLSASPELSSVLDAILALSRRIIAADAYAVWRFETARARWAIELSSGLSEDFRSRTIGLVDLSPRIFEAQIVAEDALVSPQLAGRREAYEAEGVRSLLAVPLRVRGSETGTLVFYYRVPHRFTEVEVRVATALSNLAASAIGSAELYEELKANDRRKQEFLAMLSHELRNPLSAIRSAVHLYREGASSEDREWAIDAVARQVRQLGYLVDDLLDISRVTQNKIQLRREVLDAAKVLDRAAETARPFIQERHHTLTCSYPSGALVVEADPARLEQVVVNLLTNAAKYTEPGGRIALEGSRDEQGVLIRVHDTGIGIAADLLPSLFDLFTQGERSIDRSEGGLGIGLTLVKSLTEMHGGSVLASSAGPGQGSEFVVRLPAATTAPPPSLPAAPAVRGKSGGSRVLVVDDNTDTAKSVARLLTLSGYRVRTAHDGLEAIVVARDQRPEFILLDIGLPGMDGFQVAETLRAEGCCPSAMFVAISGYGDERTRQKSRDAGFDDHFVKPLDFDALLDLLAARKAGGGANGAGP